MIKRITLLILLLIVVYSASGQTKKAYIANTTWIISQRLCNDKDYLGSDAIQLLPEGKVKSFVDGSWTASQYGRWSLTDSRLQMDDNNEIFIRSFEVTLKGNVGTGRGFSQLAKAFCIRIAKRITLPIPKIPMQPENGWLGTYSFIEGVPRGHGNVGNVAHTIRIFRSGNSLWASLEADGWQTTEKLNCTAEVVGNKINFYFKSYGDTAGTPMMNYRKGRLLLTLTRSGNRILTYWGAYKPVALENGRRSGKVFFRKE